MEYVICTAQNFWSDTEAQLLMDKFREYQHDVGPMKKFKNKKCMWEKISADILAELGSLKTGAQCENRFKTVRKRKGWVDIQDEKSGSLDMNGSEGATKKKRTSDTSRVNGNSSTRDHSDSDNLHSKSQEMVDTIEAEIDVRRGVGQVSYNNPSESNDEEEKREKKRFRQTLSSVLLQIHREKEEARERRHQEKMELLKLLLQ